MSLTRPALKLTHRAALLLLQAAEAAAAAIGVPQVIIVVDEGCNVLACLHMDGSRLLSADTATHKAMTAAASGRPAVRPAGCRRMSN